MPDTAAKGTPRLGAKVRPCAARGIEQVQMPAAGHQPQLPEPHRGQQAPAHRNLLIQLAHSFQVELKSFAPDADQRVAEDLMEAFGDPLFESLDLPASEVRDLAQNEPAGPAVFLRTSHTGKRPAHAHLSDQLSDGQGFRPLHPLPSEAAGTSSSAG